MGVFKVDNNVMGDFSHIPVGTVSISPERVDAFSWCRGELVSLEEEVEYPVAIRTLETARMIARNVAPSGKAIAILKEKEGDEEIYHVYTLSHDIENFYAREGTDLIYSNFHTMGEKLPSGVRIVEIYNSDRVAYVQTIIDPAPLHSHATVDEPVVCLNRGTGNVRRIIDWKSEMIVGNRVFYVFHTIPKLQKTEEQRTLTYGTEPNVESMSADDLGAMAYFLEQADTVEKIMNLDATTLIVAGPEHRIKLGS